MRRAVPVLGIAALLAALAPSRDARAQSSAGAFRLGLEGNLLAYERSTLSLPAGAGEVSSPSTSLGLPASGLGLGVAYGVSESVLLGARLLVASDNTDIEGTSTHQTRFVFLPHLEYLFSGEAVRAFVSANLGYGSTSSSAEGAEASTSLFMAGPGVGVRGFASPALSLDGSLTALLTTGTSAQNAVELGVGSYTILLGVAVSAWLGAPPTSAASSAAVPSRAAIAEQHAPLAVDGDLLKSTFALDLPGAVGGVNVLLEGNPRADPTLVRIVVMWLERDGQAASCEPAAFEVDGQTSALAEVRSSSLAGFGSARSIQRGRLLATVVAALGQSESEAWLTVCGERIPVLPAAKGRIARFSSAFLARAQPTAPAPGAVDQDFER